MIRYSLKCAEGHPFDSWFRSGADFDALAAAGQLACAQCGSPDVSKALMAPPVAAREGGTAEAAGPAQDAAQKALSDLRARVESTSDYVGLSFAAEARAMHLGEKPERPIYGEARAEEARRLIEDGIPVAPLPFIPTRRAH